MARWWRETLNVFNLFGMAMIFVMMLLICGEVVLRYFFGSSIHGSIEVTQLLQVMAVGLGLGYTQVQRGHISDDFFIDMLPTGAQRALRCLHHLVAAAICAVCAYAILKLGTRRGGMREYTDSLRIPLYPFKIVLSFGFALLAIQLLIDAWQQAFTRSAAAAAAEAA